MIGIPADNQISRFGVSPGSRYRTGANAKAADRPQSTGCIIDEDALGLGVFEVGVGDDDRVCHAGFEQDSSWTVLPGADRQAVAHEHR